MTRRRPQIPGPGRDWRALATDPPQRRLGLVGTARADLPEHAHDARPDDVTVRVRTRPDGSRCALVIASVVLETPADVRAVAKRLEAAADALEDLRS